MKKAWSRKNLWDALPPSLKSGAGRMLRFAPLPWLLGGRFREQYAFLDKAQWWDEEQVRAYQFARLAEILTIAYEQTRFYRRVFDAIGFHPGDFKRLEDLAGLPRIDRDVVTANLNDMLAVPADSAGVDYTTTGGTGGRPLAFYIGADRSATEFAHLARSWARVGYRPGMKTAVLRGHVVEPQSDGLRHRHDPLLNHHIYSSFHLEPQQMERVAAHLHETRPEFLHAYPSSAYVLARFLHGEGLRFPDSLLAILLESEPVYEPQREFITREFGVRVFASYGHTEKLVLATECEHTSNYHVWPTYGYAEVLDAAGQPVVDGADGEIVGTGFINRAVPFIRYRTGDFARPLGPRCDACGRTHAIWAGVDGHRDQEFLICRNGTRVVWTALNVHDDTFDGVLEFQFVQDRPGAACLRIVPENGTIRHDAQRIKSRLEAKLNGQLTIDVQLAPTIEKTRAGKRRFVVQNLGT